jgi:hypothetical protein
VHSKPTYDTAKHILITGARAPVAASVPICWRPDTRQQYVRFSLGCASRCHSGYITLPSPRFDLAGYAEAMEHAVIEHDIELIIPHAKKSFS